MKNLSKKALLMLLFFISPLAIAEEENEEAEGIPQMNAMQRESKGIVSSTVKRMTLKDELNAPGEVRMNAYQSSQVSSRIRSQIIKRFVRMGDKVKVGQKLLTLSSVDMAEAQSQLIITDREWTRVKKLGRKVVSEKRYIGAQVKRQQAYAKALAYGMTASQTKRIIKKGDVANATGLFDLLSSQDGTVISDEFVLGQVVEPGQLLMEVSDETQLWVETRINPEDVILIESDAQARINITQAKWVNGVVSQIHRRVDETTRTLPVRVKVNNQQGLLRPGQFVKVALQILDSHEAIAIPKSSVTLLYGEQVVFLLQDDELYPQLVKTGEIRGDFIEIKKGLNEGDELIVKGMFLLKSLLLKSQIGDAD